jgi:hypothetical protein
MRSGTKSIITAQDVHTWALEPLLEIELLRKQGRKCTAVTVFGILLRAAIRGVSVCAACADLSEAPTDSAIFNALREGLPKTQKALERRLNAALTWQLPRHLTRRRREIAIDWHLVPYYGQPLSSRNEIYYGKPRQGTKKFHAYATACIVEHGQRYTLAITWVRRHESTVTVLNRLLAQIRELAVQIKFFLLDRAFFNVPVVEFLQRENCPFLMPVMFRGRRPKPGRKATGLRLIKKQKAGWYRHTMKNRGREVTVSVCVGYRTHKNRKDRKQVKQKLLFAAWKVYGSPTSIRERYRRRFGIETSYRQMRQARIYTCTRNPRLRLLFVALALLLRNVWVWIHSMKLAEGTPENPTLHLECLRFKRMLNWIASIVDSLLHDGSTPYVDLRT